MKDAAIKVLKVVFVLTALMFIAAALLGIFGSDEQRAEEKRQAATETVGVQAVAIDKQATKDEIEIIDDGRMSKAELYVECQVKVQDSLKSPRSFDPERGSLKHIVKENGNPLIGFDFYAENSFGGEEIHQAVCEFDKNDKIISAGYR